MHFVLQAGLGLEKRRSGFYKPGPKSGPALRMPGLMVESEEHNGYNNKLGSTLPPTQSQGKNLSFIFT